MEGRNEERDKENLFLSFTHIRLRWSGGEERDEKSCSVIGCFPGEAESLKKQNGCAKAEEKDVRS